MTKGPVVIDLDDQDVQSPADAPAVPELTDTAPSAMEQAAHLMARRRNVVGRWFWGVALTFVGAFASVAGWEYVNGLIGRNPVLGLVLAALGVALALVTLIVILRELAALARLGRIDRVKQRAEEALTDQDMKRARATTQALEAFYRGRADLVWARDRMSERSGDQLDAESLLTLAEAEWMTPLDKAAEAEVKAAARQVATVTALVPLALADVIAALTANIRMIRRIAEIYGGRAGTLGSWRLTRAVMTHLVATGAVALGDDMLESLVGGSVLSKLSRRFGEGVVNGALTVRVGVAAIEVCRPLPFIQRKRPKVTTLVSSALAGLFGSSARE